MTIRCICVDDEPLARQGIRLALAAYNDFALVAEFAGVEAVLAHKTDNIDVLFVDIQMPRQSGFDLLQQWPGPLPVVIFVTAYDQYAIEAFEQQALDYVLKPIEPTRFARVITRIRESLQQQKTVLNAQQLLLTIDGLKKKVDQQQKQICVKTDEGYFQIKLQDLLYIEAIGDHVCFHINHRQLISRDTLKKYIAALAQDRFYQIHKSFLVNAAHVSEVLKLRFGDSQLVLSNGDKLKLTRHYKSAIGHFTG